MTTPLSGTAAPRAPTTSAPPRTDAPVTPDRILQLSWGFAVFRTLQTAIDLDLFTRIASGHRSPAALAKAAGTSERGMTMLVNALVALGLVTRDGAGDRASLGLAPDAATFLVATSPASILDFIRFHSTELADRWGRLTECVRTGEPVLAVDRPAEGVPLWHQLVDSLFNLNFKAGTQVGEELARLYPGRPLRLLDVAAGSGVWGIAAATANPRLHAVLLDLPETLEHARRNAAKSAVAARVEFLEGDLRKTDLGEAAYDAAFLGHIVHSEGAVHARDLFRKLHRAIRPGGTIAIADFLPDPGRSSPPFPLLFALNMLVHTSEGDTYTFPEYETWLREAGFEGARLFPAASASPLIFATRAAR